MLLWIVGLPRRLAKRLLETGLFHLRRHPEHKARLMKLLASWPWLQARLYSFAISRRVSATAVAPPTPVVTPDGRLDLSAYPVSVRSTYLQLMAVRSQACSSHEMKDRT